MALNPQHNIPFYVEDGFSMNESKAILTYLADKHSDKNDKLYPKDLKTRAVVNQRLMFDTSTFIKIAGDMIVSIENSTRKICHRLYFSIFFLQAPLIFKKQLPTAEQKASLKEALGWLSDFVK